MFVNTDAYIVENLENYTFNFPVKILWKKESTYLIIVNSLDAVKIRKYTSCIPHWTFNI